jgi:hypothetical protein
LYFNLKTYHNWGTKEFAWRQGNHEPSLSVEQIQESHLSLREKKMAEFTTLCTSRNHVVISGQYINANSKVTIRCNMHNESHETTFTNYKKCKTGLKCCGRARQSSR